MKKRKIPTVAFYPGRKKEEEQSLGFHYVCKILEDKFYVEKLHLEKLKKISVDWVFSSLHFENQYPLFLKTMEEWKEKGKVVVGGPAPSSNPYPLYYLADYIVIGDAEGIDFSNIEDNPCVFIPGKKEKVKINKSNFENLEILPIHIGKDYCLLEIERGCRFNCKFCLIGYLQKPVRIHNLERYKEILKERKGIKKVFLIGSDIFSHPHLPEFLEWLARNKYQVAIPSLRIDIAEKYLELLEKLKIRQITLAPESSERIRVALNKSIYDEAIEELAKKIKVRRFRSIKLYFMLGLPEEEDKDIMEIIKLIKKIKESSGKKLRITFSAFVPKVGTPLQFSRIFEIGKYQQRRKIIKRNYPKAFIANPKHAYVQSLLSIGDKDISRLLLSSYKHGLNYVKWERVAEKLKIDIEKYLDEKDMDFFRFFKVDLGIKFEWLYKEYRKYLNKVS